MVPGDSGELTRPWAVVKKDGRSHRKSRNDPRKTVPRATVTSSLSYFLAAGGNPMPASKDQPAPDLRFFRQTTKRE